MAQIAQGKMTENSILTKVLLDRYMKKVFTVLIAFALLLFLLPVQAQNASAVSDAAGLQLEQQVFEIARKVRCPVCRAESAADSNATTSVEFRNIIQEKLEEGQSEAEIIAFFQASYGDWILLDPPKRGLHLIVWIAPLVAALIGIAIFFTLLRRWTRKANAAPVELSAEELEKVRLALADSLRTESERTTSGSKGELGEQV